MAKEKEKKKEQKKEQKKERKKEQKKEETEKRDMKFLNIYICVNSRKYIPMFLWQKCCAIQNLYFCLVFLPLPRKAMKAATDIITTSFFHVFQTLYTYVLLICMI